MGTLGLIIAAINIFAAGEMYNEWKRGRERYCWYWIVFNSVIGIYCAVVAVGIIVRENI